MAAKSSTIGLRKVSPSGIYLENIRAHGNQYPIQSSRDPVYHCAEFYRAFEHLCGYHSGLLCTEMFYSKSEGVLQNVGKNGSTKEVNSSSLQHATYICMYVYMVNYVCRLPASHAAILE